MTARHVLPRLGVALMFGAASPAQAHQLNVFASADCSVLTVEAKFSTGNAPQGAELRLIDAAGTLNLATTLGADGTLGLPLDGLDTGAGVTVEVATPDHDGYWIMTPDDFARGCPQ